MPALIEPFYERWEQKWHADGGKDINNPKILPEYVRSVGELVYRAPDISVISPELSG